MHSNDRGTMHGCGSYLYSNGIQYVGEFQHGVRSGTQTYNDVYTNPNCKYDSAKPPTHHDCIHHKCMIVLNLPVLNPTGETGDSMVHVILLLSPVSPNGLVLIVPRQSYFTKSNPYI